MNEFFRRCSTCKSPIGWGTEYFTCSVSTCNQKRTALFFCSLPCWDAHVPGARHRDAWAEKQVAPREAQEGDDSSGEEAKRRRVVSSGASVATKVSAHPALSGPATTTEVLVVVSKLKTYIRERSGMNTSAGVMDMLSQHLRDVCDGPRPRRREGPRPSPPPRHWLSPDRLNR